MTVTEWANRWMKAFPGQRLPSTVRDYEAALRPFVHAHANWDLRWVTPLIAQEWVSERPRDVVYLRLMFSKAFKAGLVDMNVFRMVEVPAVRREPRVPPTPAQLDALVASARAFGGWREKTFADLIVFAAYSGLRVSEVCGVKTQDVLDSGRRVVVRGKRRAGDVEPRERIVVAFEPGREALMRHVTGRPLVWTTSRGGRLDKNVVSKHWCKIREPVGFDGVFHTLRHFHASWLEDRGADQRDIAIQLGHIDRAGHADVSQLRRTYGHPNVESALCRLERVGDGEVSDAGNGAGPFARAAAGGVGEGQPDQARTRGMEAFCQGWA